MTKNFFPLLFILFNCTAIASDVISFDTCKYEGGLPTILKISNCSEAKICSGPVICKTQSGIESYESFCQPSTNGECPEAGECFKQYLTGENFYVEKSKIGTLDIEEPPFGNLPNGFRPVRPTIHTFDKPGTEPTFKKEKSKKERSKSF